MFPLSKILPIEILKSWLAKHACKRHLTHVPFEGRRWFGRGLDNIIKDVTGGIKQQKVPKVPFSFLRSSSKNRPGLFFQAQVYTLFQCKTLLSMSSTKPSSHCFPDFDYLTNPLNDKYNKGLQPFCLYKNLVNAVVAITNKMNNK